MPSLPSHGLWTSSSREPQISIIRVRAFHGDVTGFKNPSLNWVDLLLWCTPGVLCAPVTPRNSRGEAASSSSHGHRAWCIMVFYNALLPIAFPISPLVTALSWATTQWSHLPHKAQIISPSPLDGSLGPVRDIGFINFSINVFINLTYSLISPSMGDEVSTLLSLKTSLVSYAY